MNFISDKTIKFFSYIAAYLIITKLESNIQNDNLRHLWCKSKGKCLELLFHFCHLYSLTEHFVILDLTLHHTQPATSQLSLLIQTILLKKACIIDAKTKRYKGKKPLNILIMVSMTTKLEQQTLFWIQYSWTKKSTNFQIECSSILMLHLIATFNFVIWKPILETANLGTIVSIGDNTVGTHSTYWIIHTYTIQHHAKCIFVDTKPLVAININIISQEI